ncbi:unnamed protein product [Parnassius apollo]|uniref:(apollo) hypothetical protein n=1 Tax=Parnassius apollo TaxID=110799 RepID=A0A8S3Y4B9_PARAO|nr:unnamed protein product [Parnassius apollo]
MFGAILFLIIPTLISCASEGNIHLLEEEIAAAIRACTPNDSVQNTSNTNHRSRRSNKATCDDEFRRIDSNTKFTNPYDHQRRNTSDMIEQKQIINITSIDFIGYENQSANENFNSSSQSYDNSVNSTNTNNSSLNRTKRNEHLLEKSRTDECLSQCVFSNLHVVDSRGIPREADFWNKVQTSVTSQRSRTLIQDQIRACFQELQSDTEEDGCSYSNKLERCLMLRFSDRKKEITKSKNST